MQAEAPFVERLTHAYATYRATRLLCLLAVLGAAVLLFLLSGGFPPWAWRLLVQTVPHVPTLLAQRGQAVWLALLGLVSLSVTLLLAWWALFWLAWRMLAYGIYERSELQRFATDMQEAHHLAQEEEAYAAVSRTPFTDQLEEAVYAVQELEPAHEAAYANEPAAFWTEANIASRSYPRPLYALSAEPTQPNVGLAVMRTPFAPPSPMPTHAVPVITEKLVYHHSAVIDPTTPLPPTLSEPVGARAGTQLVVSTGLDAGLKRKGKPNEDSLLALQNTRILRDCRYPVGLFVIADGMGGHENGQEASRLVIQSLSTTLAPLLMAGPPDDDYAELLAESVHRANLALYQRNRQQQTDMGTTLAAALVINTTAYIANVGDSRVYLYRAASGLSQVTRDHSTVALLVEEGALRPEDVYTHPRRNEIYRSLGHQASQDVDSFILAVQPGDLLLLCSDGLWEMVRDAQMQHILAGQEQPPAQLSAALVQAALDGGGKDNISVIVVGVQAGEETRAAWAS